MEIVAKKSLIPPLFGVIISTPIIYLVLFALSGEITMDGIKSLNIGTYALNTTLLVAGVLFLVLIFGGVSAYLVARFEFFGSRFYSIALALPLALPSYIVGYTYNGIFEYAGLLSQLTSLDLRFDILNIYGAIFIFSISMFPYLFIVAKAATQSLSNSVDEVVRLSGVGEFRAFFTIYLPLIYPALFIGIFLCSMEVISDYGTVIYFGVETFSVGVFKQWFGYANLEGAIQISIALMLFVFVILLLESKAKAKIRYSSSSFSSKKLQKKRLKKTQAFFASLFCFVLFFISFITPLCVLVYWSYLDLESFDFDYLVLFFNTLSLNLGSSLSIMFLAFIVLFFITNYKTKLSTISYKLSLLGYSIPGAVVGIGALLLFSSFDNLLGAYIFGGSFFVLMFAYLIRFYPAGVGSLNSGFSKVTNELNEASKLYGKDESMRIKSVYLPLVKGSLISGFLIVFIDISKELPATLMLRPFNFDTLAIRVYELAQNEMLPTLGIPSLMLLSMTIVAVLLLNLRIFR